MITENETQEEQDPKILNKENESAPTMNADDKDEDEEENEDEVEEEDEKDEDDGDYTILPSNDSGITADDNAATGKMHEKEGE